MGMGRVSLPITAQFILNIHTIIIEHGDLLTCATVFGKTNHVARKIKYCVACENGCLSTNDAKKRMLLKDGVSDSLNVASSLNLGVTKQFFFLANWSIFPNTVTYYVGW